MAPLGNQIPAPASVAARPLDSRRNWQASLSRRASASSMSAALTTPRPSASRRGSQQDVVRDVHSMLDKSAREQTKYVGRTVSGAGLNGKILPQASSSSLPGAAPLIMARGGNNMLNARALDDGSGDPLRCQMQTNPISYKICHDWKVNDRFPFTAANISLNTLATAGALVCIACGVVLAGGLIAGAGGAAVACVKCCCGSSKRSKKPTPSSIELGQRSTA